LLPAPQTPAPEGGERISGWAKAVENWLKSAQLSGFQVCAKNREEHLSSRVLDFTTEQKTLFTLQTYFEQVNTMQIWFILRVFLPHLPPPACKTP
jgi:hypothetical protein